MCMIRRLTGTPLQLQYQYLHYHLLLQVLQEEILSSCLISVFIIILEKRIINTWNSLPDLVANVDSINTFQNRLDTFWSDQYNLLCLIIQLNLSR